MVIDPMIMATYLKTKTEHFLFIFSIQYLLVFVLTFPFKSITYKIKSYDICPLWFSVSNFNISSSEIITIIIICENGKL